MFQPMMERVDSLTIDDVTGQAVPESGTGRTECSFADSMRNNGQQINNFELN